MLSRMAPDQSLLFWRKQCLQEGANRQSNDHLCRGPAVNGSKRTFGDACFH